MARVNFREIREGFKHIDAKFVASESSGTSRTASFSVKFYPYWEHPRLIEAVAAGKRWGFNESVKEGEREVTVHAIGLLKLGASVTVDVEEWDFHERHPWLWPYEEKGHITCNSSLRFDECLEIIEAALDKLGFPQMTAEALDYVDIENVRRYGSSPPFSLGRLPRPLYLSVKEELQRRGVETFSNCEPKLKDLPVLFLADDDNFMIAEDFEVDIPDFEHKDEWFRG